MLAIEVPQNEENSGGGKNEVGKRVGSIFYHRNANKGTINIKEREQGGIV